jgi:hypothetical protein
VPSYGGGFTSTEFDETAGNSSTMADPLVSALERVHLGANNENGDNWIIKQDQEELKRSLEEKFLTPFTSFSSEWLNKLQQYAFRPVLKGGS